MTAPQRYRRRPQEVTAVQWTGENADDVCLFAVAPNGVHQRFEPGTRSSLLTSGGFRRDCPPGTWIVAEPDGTGFYPVSADDFAAGYEPVEDPS